MSLILSGSDGVSDIDGSASTPAIRGTDTNTGIFFPAADTIAFAEGGAEAMRIDSSGNVGIGTSSPTVKTQIEGSANSAPVTLLRLNNAGTTAGGPGLASRISFTGGATALGFVQGSNFSSGVAGIQLSGDGTNVHASLDNSGNLLVGTTSSINVASGSTDGATIYPSSLQISRNDGTPLLMRRRSSNGEMVAFRRDTTFVGSISVTTTATAYNTSSDYRLKDNIQPLQNALGVVAQLKPVTYKWKSDGSDGQGFIAHELAEVVPDCVTGEKDAVEEDGSIKAQAIDTSFLVATLTAALQEAHGLIKDLQARVDVLESK
jgi:hypothetical protein